MATTGTQTRPFRFSLQVAQAESRQDWVDVVMEVGIGAGHSKPEYERAGIAFDDAPTRVGRMEEAVAALRSLLDGDTVDLEGEHYTLRGERCEPRPVQPRVPILVGGAGRRVHQIAARHADGVGFTGLGRVHDDGQKPEPARFPVRCHRRGRGGGSRRRR